MFNLFEISAKLEINPPTWYIRKGEFPNCPSVFQAILDNPTEPKLLGKRFMYLCRITGFTWMVWIFNMLIMSIAVVTFAYPWGKSIDMSSQLILGFSYKMIIAMLLTVLFFGLVMYSNLRIFCMQITDKCYDHVSKKKNKRKTS